jgi:hypothetical protein
MHFQPWLPQVMEMRTQVHDWNKRLVSVNYNVTSHRAISAVWTLLDNFACLRDGGQTVLFHKEIRTHQKMHLHSHQE